MGKQSSAGGFIVETTDPLSLLLAGYQRRSRKQGGDRAFQEACNQPCCIGLPGMPEVGCVRHDPWRQFCEADHVLPPLHFFVWKWRYTPGLCIMMMHATLLLKIQKVSSKGLTTRKRNKIKAHKSDKIERA